MKIQLIDPSKIRLHIDDVQIDDINIEKDYKHIPGIGHKLGRYILPDKVVERMKKLAYRSEEIQKEIGFNLCVNKHARLDDNSQLPITTGLTSIGDESEIRTMANPRQRCPPNTVHIGKFHTHPNADSANMSPGDVISMCEDDIACIGTHEEINCFVRKSGHAYREIQHKCEPLYDEIKKIKAQIKQHEKQKDKEKYIYDRQKFFQDHFKETKIEFI